MPVLKEKRWGTKGEKGKRAHGALPQQLHFLGGVPHFVLEAKPAQTCLQLLLLLRLVGGQLLGATDTQTHAHRTQSLLASCRVTAAQQSSSISFRVTTPVVSPLCLAPHQKSLRGKGSGRSSHEDSAPHSSAGDGAGPGCLPHTPGGPRKGRLP